MLTVWRPLAIVAPKLQAVVPAAVTAVAPSTWNETEEMVGVGQTPGDTAEVPEKPTPGTLL